MKPASKDITIYRGDTYSLFGRIRDKVWDEATSAYIPGPYKDLTGWTGTAQFRATAENATVAGTFTVTLGNQTTAPGSFFMTMSDEETGALTVLAGVYDLQFTTPTGEKFTYLAGKVTVTADVTRP